MADKKERRLFVLSEERDIFWKRLHFPEFTISEKQNQWRWAIGWIFQIT